MPYLGDGGEEVVRSVCGGGRRSARIRSGWRLMECKMDLLPRPSLARLRASAVPEWDAYCVCVRSVPRNPKFA